MIVGLFIGTDRWLILFGSPSAPKGTISMRVCVYVGVCFLF